MRSYRNNTKQRISFLLFLLVISINISIIPENIEAGAPEYIPKNDKDFAILPPYCAAKMKGTGSSIWKKRLGAKNFVHIHHMCFALNAKVKAMTTSDKADKKFLYQTAIGNFDYVETHTEPNFILRETVYIEKAKIFKTMDRDADAVKYYLKAISFKPDYPKAYSEYAKYHISKKNYKEAEKVLLDGLKKIPNSRYLAKKLKRVRKKIK